MTMGTNTVAILDGLRTRKIKEKDMKDCSSLPEIQKELDFRSFSLNWAMNGLINVIKERDQAREALVKMVLESDRLQDE